MGMWDLKLMMCICEGVHMCMCEGVHSGFGFGKWNVEGEMILELADALNLAVLNTWFKKASRLFTYENGGM